MSKDKPKDDYEVGYGKPPKSTRFRKGVSGNPNGRPKKPIDFKQQLLREARLPVVINENGRTIRIAKHDVALRQLLHKAMKGDTNAMKMFFGYYQQATEEASLLPPPGPEFGERAKDLTDVQLESILAQHLEEMEREKKGEMILLREKKRVLSKQ